MNNQPPEPHGEPAIVSPQPIEEQWANALDCGALGPSREEPQLFYQVEKC